MSVNTRDQGGEYEIKPWVSRLIQFQGIVLSENHRKWFAISLDRFLRWCRQRTEPLELEAAIEGYLAEMHSADPPPHAWQIAQVEQALDAFRHGTMDWRWETSAAGRLYPRFRLRTPGSDSAGATDAAGAEPQARRADEQDPIGNAGRTAAPTPGTEPSPRPADPGHLTRAGQGPPAGTRQTGRGPGPQAPRRADS